VHDGAARDAGALIPSLAADAEPATWIEYDHDGKKFATFQCYAVQGNCPRCMTVDLYDKGASLHVIPVGMTRCSLRLTLALLLLLLLLLPSLLTLSQRARCTCE
jgi:hypothetical protein